MADRKVVRLPGGKVSETEHKSDGSSTETIYEYDWLGQKWLVKVIIHDKYGKSKVVYDRDK